MDIKFHLPDFFGHLKLNLILADTMKARPEWFRDGVKIASVYGVFPTSIWNGGRLAYGITSERKIKDVIKLFNDRDIPIRYTFTNLMLTEEHLDDKFCNDALKLADNGFNEVIVASPVLEKYIRENYPNYKITSSTCKQIEDIDELKSELEKDYYLVVLDYNLNHRFDILENLPHKEKCEILINATCIPNCPNRGLHYRTIGEELINYDKFRKNPKLSSKPFEPNIYQCPFKQAHLYDDTDYKTRISADDLYNKFVPKGYNQFKIEGRTISSIEVLENYVYYMVKPEFKDAARFQMLKTLTANIKDF